MSFVGKCNSISYGKAALRYAEFRILKDMDERTGKYDKKPENEVHIAKELCRNNLFEGLTPDECIGQMEDWKEITGHANIKNGYFWLSFNPSAEVCEMLENGGIDVNGEKKTWEDVCNDFMQRMGLDNTMWVAVTHDRTEKKEKGRKHIHMLACRIDKDGNLISDKFCGKKAKKVSEEMSLDYGLTMARDVKSDRKLIRKVAMQELAKLPTCDMDLFLKALQARGISVTPYKDKNDNIKGYNVSIGNGHVHKLSQIDRGLTAAHIKNTYDGLQIRKAALQELSKLPEYNFESYREALRKCGIEVELYKGKQGNEYRMSISGSNYRHDASRLDKGLSLSNLASTHNRLRSKREEEYNPNKIAKEMGMESVRVWKKGDRTCWVEASLTNGHKKSIQISNKDYYDFERGQMTRAQVAVKNLLKDGGQGHGQNREWEVGVQDDYEDSIRNSYRYTR